MSFPLSRTNLSSIHGREGEIPDTLKESITTCKDWHFQGFNIMKRKEENKARKEVVKQNPVPGVKIFGW